MRQKMVKHGFTLIEILMVVVILGIAATAAVTMIGNSSDLQVRAAGQELVATLSYAQSCAIAKNKIYQVAFDPDQESFIVQTVAGTVTTTVADPVRKTPFQMIFPQSKRFSKVRLDSADFGGARNIWFDRLGAPFSGPVPNNTPMLNKGSIVLAAGESRMTIEVEPVTGKIKLKKE